MIAADTGHDLVLEDDFGYGNLNQLAAFLYSDYSPIVVQCPFLCHIAHDFGYEFSIDMTENLVVMMHRYRQDIIDSENRAVYKNGQSIGFDKVGGSQAARYNAEPGPHISDRKYEVWQEQCVLIPNALDVGYESLRGHPLWIEDRNFSIRQTSYDEEPDIVPTLRRLPDGALDAVRLIRKNQTRPAV